MFTGLGPTFVSKQLTPVSGSDQGGESQKIRWFLLVGLDYCNGMQFIFFQYCLPCILLNNYWIHKKKCLYTLIWEI